jgi:hypothetical protein
MMKRPKGATLAEIMDATGKRTPYWTLSASWAATEARRSSRPRTPRANGRTRSANNFGQLRLQMPLRLCARACFERVSDAVDHSLHCRRLKIVGRVAISRFFHVVSPVWSVRTPSAQDQRSIRTSRTCDPERSWPRHCTFSPLCNIAFGPQRWPC